MRAILFWWFLTTHLLRELTDFIHKIGNNPNRRIKRLKNQNTRSFASDFGISRTGIGAGFSITPSSPYRTSRPKPMSMSSTVRVRSNGLWNAMQSPLIRTAASRTIRTPGLRSINMKMMEIVESLPSTPKNI